MKTSDGGEKITFLRIRILAGAPGVFSSHFPRRCPGDNGRITVIMMREKKTNERGTSFPELERLTGCAQHQQTVARKYLLDGFDTNFKNKS